MDFTRDGREVVKQFTKGRTDINDSQRCEQPSVVSSAALQITNICSYFGESF